MSNFIRVSTKIKEYYEGARERVTNSPVLSPYADILLRDGWHPSHYKNLCTWANASIIKWVEEYKAFQRWLDENKS